MPLYFFHVSDEAGQHNDHAGTVLTDVADARREAVTRAETLIGRRSAEAWYNHSWTMTVRDQAGDEVLRLTIERHPESH